MKTLLDSLIVVLVLGWSLAGLAETTASETLLGAVNDGQLQQLLADLLQDNPAVQAAQARAAAAGWQVPQAGTVPDPQVGLTAFVLAPETRTGPQLLSASLAQRLPVAGTRKLNQQAARYDAARAHAEVEALRLSLLYQARKLYHEIGFLDVLGKLVAEDRATLVHFEQLARARYASGVGLQLAVVKLQAEISRSDARSVEIAGQRTTLVAAINALANRGQEQALIPGRLRNADPPDLDFEQLRARALMARPEMAGAEANIAGAQTRVALANTASRPGLTVGLSWTVVGRRSDPGGRSNPPADNGQDILAVSGAVNLPFRRPQLAAKVAEAVQRRLASEADRRARVAAIEQDLGALVERIPLIRSQLRLFEQVLEPQCRQSLRSAEAGYAAGTLDAVGLLDATRTLLEVRIAASRARADQAIALAKLESVIASPLRGGGLP